MMEHTTSDILNQSLSFPVMHDLVTQKVFGPSNFISLIVPRRCFFCGSIYFKFWSQIIVLFDPYMRFHIFIEVKVT